MGKNIAVLLFFAIISATALGSLPSADVKDDRPVPVIDIHTHIFNALDLPIRGIIRTQYINGVRVPDRIARIVDKILQRMAKGDVFESAPQSKDQLDALLDEPRPSTLDLNEQAELAAFVKANDVVVEPQQFDAEMAAMGSEAEKERLLASRVLDLAGVVAAAPMDEVSLISDTEKTNVLAQRKVGYWGLVKLLVQRRMHIAQHLTDITYGEADMFVHHMMDMELAYDDKPELRFHKQVPLFKEIDGHSKGKLLRFVAYDPFRGGEAIDIVKSAWKDGAGGVKFYPSSGYRPSNNEIPVPPAWWNVYQWRERQRWRSAYGRTSNVKLDAQIRGLVHWAVGEKVPIFAHTDKDDMSPNPTYWLNADPKLWKVYLDNGETEMLRLCFAHGGGDYYWTSDPADDEENLKRGSNDPWRFGYEIVQLCRQYENVYLELGCLQSVLDPKKHAAIVNRLTHDLADPVPSRFRLGDKIMYGSDWTMLAQNPAHKKYLKEFDKVMREVSGGAWHRKFFSGNAVKFLRLEERLNDDTRLHAEQRDHWRTRIIPFSQPASTPSVE